MAVHLQLLPDGAFRFTRQRRESVQPPFLIKQGLSICGQLSSTAVIAYILWLPKNGTCKLFCLSPSPSTLSNFLLSEKKKKQRPIYIMRIMAIPYSTPPPMRDNLRHPIRPEELVVCEDQPERISQLIRDDTPFLRVQIYAFHPFRSGIGVA